MFGNTQNKKNKDMDFKKLFNYNKEKNTVECKAITIPTSWDELKLGQYQNLQAYYKSLKEDEQVDTKKILSLLSNYTEDEVMLLPLSFITTLISKLDFLKELPNPQISNKIEIDNETYYLNNMEDLRFGEWVDSQTAMQNDNNDYATILAILCRKANEIYDQKYINNEFDKRVEMFKNISVNQALSILGFFLKYCEMSKIPSQAFINQVKQEVESYANSIESLIANGDSSRLCTFLLKRKLKKYQSLLKQI